MAALVPGDLSARIASVRGRVAAACARAGRAPDGVRVVAVAKRMPAALVREAATAGVDVIGENYLQEAEAKRAELADVPGLEWHFIGRVQRNKAARLTDFALVHSIADARIAAALDRAAETRALRVPVLLQVNLSGESTKDGVTAADLPRLLADVRSLAHIRVVGLMTMPPPLPPEEVRPIFAALRELRDRQKDAAELRELSMGMSGDFEVAIEEGASLVRVGTAIFGPRPGGTSRARADGDATTKRRTE